MGGGVLPHVFIINPAAGHKNAAVWLEPQIRAAAAGLGLAADTAVVQTCRPGHARELTRRLAAGNR